MEEKDENGRYPHPAKMWPTRWFFHDRSDESVEEQIMDSLYDIRIILWIWFLLWIIW